MKSNLDKVTIITPAFNCISFFRDTFVSVLKQKYKNFEWIIIDDCSTDGSFEYIRELTKEYKNIILVKTYSNGGTAKARNMGLRLSTGRYITFLDSDDILDDDYLEKQVEFIKNNGPLITSGYRRMYKNKFTNFIPRPSIEYNDLLKGNDASCLTTMFDKLVCGNFFFPENFKKQEDYVFWLNILKKGFCLKTNPQILATYRIHDCNKNKNKLKLIIPQFKVYYKSQKLGFLKSIIYVFRWGFYGIRKNKNIK